MIHPRSLHFLEPRPPHPEWWCLMLTPSLLIVWSKRAQEWVAYEEHGPTLGCYRTLLEAEAAVIAESERREALAGAS